MEGGSGAAIYLSNGLRPEFYCIDLDCLPEKVSPITKFADEATPGWTVVDKCIYCIGGVKDSEEYKSSYTVGKTLHTYNRSTPTKWESIEPDRILRWFQPFVFAFGRKIYVVGGHQLRPDGECEKDTDWTHLGEYYHLDTGKWQRMPKLDDGGTIDFPSFSIARVMDDNKTTILFYSDTTFLLYDLVEDAWKHNCWANARLGVRDGLEECKCIDILFIVIGNSRPVVCDSTLYWLNNDLRLYGFDYSRKRWFRSNILHPQILWPSLTLNRDSLCDMPLLFYLNNQTFVAVCGTDEELTLAIITVERDIDSGSINVSLKSSKKIGVGTSHSHVVLVDGMTIWKDEGSTTTNNNMLSISGKDEGSILGKREHALVD